MNKDIINDITNPLTLAQGMVVRALADLMKDAKGNEVTIGRLEKAIDSLDAISVILSQQKPSDVVSATPAGTETGVLKDKTILIVDDEPDIREMLKEFLETLGMKVLEANQGVLAFAVLSKTPVQAVITDIRMSEGDGLELIDRINQTYVGPNKDKRPFVLLMTGYQDITRTHAKGRGVDEVISKPFNLNLLSSKLVKLFSA